VQAYRLIGYENRMLKKEDFNDDKKDAGEIGSGHSVTALYEVVPVGVESDVLKKVDPLKYQTPSVESPLKQTSELMTIKFRYKKPDGETSRLIVQTLNDMPIKFSETSDNFRFASSVTQFGMLLRESNFKGNSSYNGVLELAGSAKGGDKEGYRGEFIKLVKKAMNLGRAVAEKN
jgi:Ca-activated chloride channel homolog